MNSPDRSPASCPPRKGKFARRRGAAALALALMGPGWLPAAAQQVREPAPAYVYPAGGRAGTTFVVQVGGQAFAGATNLYLSGGGFEATLLDYSRPLTPREFNQLRNELEQLQEKRRTAATHWTEADASRVAEIRRQLATRAPNRQANPALAETLTFRVRLAPDAAPGSRELRLVTDTGLTPPLRFLVGTLPEVKEPEPATPATSSEANPRAALRSGRSGPATTPAKEPLAVDLPVVVNGRLFPGEVDRFRFQARRGQRLVFMVQARALIPFLADAVPGWFQAVLTLRDARDREVAYCDDYRLQPDPVILYEVPADGTYTLELRDALYRGREDFVYHLTLGELPFVTGVEPLGGPVHRPWTARMSGWNLPATELTVHRSEPGIFRAEPPAGSSWLNEVWLATDALPVRVETSPNDLAATAPLLDLPVVINGRIDPAGEVDWFALRGQAGETVVAEVRARRLGSPLDARLVLTDAAGRELAANDDQPDPGRGLDTHHADAYLRVTLPADGVYRVRLEDAQGKGGPEFGYRLRLGPPQPDFELRVVPSALHGRAGATVPLTVWALRRDGFAGDIHLALADAPPGFSLGGAWVPAGLEKVRVTLTLPPDPSPEPRPLRMVGRARVDGRELERPAVPADERMQAFFYHHLVPAQEWLASVLESPRPAPRVRLLSATPVRIPAGGTGTVALGVPFARWAGQFRFELEEAPEGLALADTTPGRHGLEIRLQADPERLQPGQKGNLILAARASRPATSTNRPAAVGARQRAPAFVLPAIPFEITERPR